jgi:hypothetical protein
VGVSKRKEKEVIKDITVHTANAERETDNNKAMLTAQLNAKSSIDFNPDPKPFLFRFTELSTTFAPIEPNDIEEEVAEGLAIN